MNHFPYAWDTPQEKPPCFILSDFILVITHCADKIRGAEAFTVDKSCKSFDNSYFCLVSLKESVILNEMSSMWQNKAPKAACGSK